MKISIFIFFCSIYYLFSQDIYLPFPDTSSEPNIKSIEKEFFSDTEKKKEKQKKTKVLPLFKKKKKKKKEEVSVVDPSKISFEKGLFYFQNGEIEQAKFFFQKAAQSEGSYSQQAQIELGKLNENINSENSTENTLEDDKKWQMLLEQAKTLHASDFQKSQSIYLDLITQAPEPYKSSSLIAIANLMMKQKKWKDAKIYLLRFLKNHPNHLKRDLVVFLLAKIETKLQNIPKAKKYYRMFQTKEFKNSIYRKLAEDKLRNLEY